MGAAELEPELGVPGPVAGGLEQERDGFDPLAALDVGAGERGGDVGVAPVEVARAAQRRPAALGVAQPAPGDAEVVESARVVGIDRQRGLERAPGDLEVAAREVEHRDAVERLALELAGDALGLRPAQGEHLLEAGERRVRASLARVHEGEVVEDPGIVGRQRQGRFESAPGFVGAAGADRGDRRGGLLGGGAGPALDGGTQGVLEERGELRVEQVGAEGRVRPLESTRSSAPAAPSRSPSWKESQAAVMPRRARSPGSAWRAARPE